MALICNDCNVKGRNKQIWCKYTGEPCLYMRYCAVSMKYYQTDEAKKCKVKENHNGKKY